VSLSLGVKGDDINDTNDVRRYIWGNQDYILSIYSNSLRDPWRTLRVTGAIHYHAR
jgi:hypothetical protein